MFIQKGVQGNGLVVCLGFKAKKSLKFSLCERIYVCRVFFESLASQNPIGLDMLFWWRLK